jgi:hypothetical protein
MWRQRYQQVRGKARTPKEGEALRAAALLGVNFDELEVPGIGGS